MGFHSFFHRFVDNVYMLLFTENKFTHETSIFHQVSCVNYDWLLKFGRVMKVECLKNKL